LENPGKTVAVSSAPRQSRISYIASWRVSAPFALCKQA